MNRSRCRIASGGLQVDAGKMNCTTCDMWSDISAPRSVSSEQRDLAYVCDRGVVLEECLTDP